MARLGSVEDAVRNLRNGGLACFPTETVWSLSGLAERPDIAARIREAKGRPGDMPLAVGFATWQTACLYTRPSGQAHFLAETWLPGPLSIIVAGSDDSLAHVAPGTDTLSVRIPDHPIAQAVLAAAGPLIMTSANRHGEADPTTADEVLAAMGHLDDLVVVDSDPVAGKASTIVDATGPEPRVLREGVITKAEVAATWPS